MAQATEMETLEVPEEEETSLKEMLAKEGLLRAVQSGTCAVLVGGERVKDLNTIITQDKIVAVVPVVQGGT